MTVFGLYRELDRGRNADLYRVNNGAAYDHAMSWIDGFEAQNGIKKIQWLDGQPHATQKPGGKLVRFHTLHFQGGAKRFLRAHVHLTSLRLKMLHQWNRLVAERGKLLEKISRLGNGSNPAGQGIKSKPA
jgi:hypothetical protein